MLIIRPPGIIIKIIIIIRIIITIRRAPAATGAAGGAASKSILMCDLLSSKSEYDVQYQTGAAGGAAPLKLRLEQVAPQNAAFNLKGVSRHHRVRAQSRAGTRLCNTTLQCVKAFAHFAGKTPCSNTRRVASEHGALPRNVQTPCRVQAGVMERELVSQIRPF